MENITEYAAFSLWFTRINSSEWNVEEADTGKHIGVYKEKIRAFIPLEDGQDIPAKMIQEVRDAFEAFKEGRPEYWVGASLQGVKVNDADLYDTLLRGCLYIRARRNGHADPDKASNAAQNCINWLHGTDFYIAPASTQYHESYAGGLCYHTLRAYHQMLDLLYGVTAFSKIAIDSAVFCILVHDWCKIGLYEMYKKNVKDNATGQWHQEDAYRHTGEMIPLGHGVQSIFLASRFVRLTPEEACAIRWHMGAWRVVPSEMNDLQKANETYPLVHLLQFADQLSIVNYS